jgi:hypothetical protein
MGQAADPETPANNTEYYAYEYREPLQANVPETARSAVTFRGGDRFLGKMMFGPSDIGDITLDMSAYDADLAAFMTDADVDVLSNTVWTQFIMAYNNPNPPQLGMMLRMRFQSRKSGTDGGAYWLNLIYPRVQASPSWGGANFQTEGSMPITVSPTFSDKRPTGEDLTAFGVRDDRALAYGIVTSHPLHIVTYVADGTATAFVADRQPANTSSVDADGGPNAFFVNGVATDLSAIEADGDVTMASAGTDGDICVLLYEIDDRMIAVSGGV